ncbi:hypothetical protein E4U42_007696 [Claviceps africana]|uniref:Uncharacterized protein n=1 Tax=Claviceps africana TaxID=83212 RepID=A0A8K0JF84_9HYPO|nr:hypothetical protein E4U42_007696 [Claviceps africana]
MNQSTDLTIEQKAQNLRDAVQKLANIKDIVGASIKNISPAETACMIVSMEQAKTVNKLVPDIETMEQSLRDFSRYLLVVQTILEEEARKPGTKRPDDSLARWIQGSRAANEAAEAALKKYKDAVNVLREPLGLPSPFAVVSERLLEMNALFHAVFGSPLDVQERGRKRRRTDNA